MAKKIKKQVKRYYKKAIASGLILAMAMAYVSVEPAKAAALTSVSDTLTDSRPSDGSGSQTADHLIYFVTPTGIGAGEKIKITFPSNFDLAQESVAFADIDLDEGSTGTCASATWTDEPLAAAPSGGTWGATVSSQVLTFVSGTGTIPASRCVRVLIGHNADGPGVNQIENPTTTGTKTITITTTTSGDVDIDTGRTQIAILNGVAVTATINKVMTFVSSDYAVGFGGITSGTLRYATSDATGQDSSAPGAGDPFVLTLTSNTSGATISVKSINTNSTAGLYSATGTHTLTAGSVATVIATPGTDGFAVYGVGSGITMDTGFDGASGNVAVSTSNQRFAYSSTGDADTVEVDLVAASDTASPAQTDYATTLVFVATPVY